MQSLVGVHCIGKRHFELLMEISKGRSLALLNAAQNLAQKL